MSNRKSSWIKWYFSPITGNLWAGSHLSSVSALGRFGGIYVARSCCGSWVHTHNHVQTQRTRNRAGQKQPCWDFSSIKEKLYLESFHKEEFFQHHFCPIFPTALGGWDLALPASVGEDSHRTRVWGQGCQPHVVSIDYRCTFQLNIGVSRTHWTLGNCRMFPRTLGNCRMSDKFLHHWCSQKPPPLGQVVNHALRIWNKVGECMSWSRVYGLIEVQDTNGSENLSINFSAGGALPPLTQPCSQKENLGEAPCRTLSSTEGALLLPLPLPICNSLQSLSCATSSPKCLLHACSVMSDSLRSYGL